MDRVSNKEEKEEPLGEGRQKQGKVERKEILNFFKRQQIRPLAKM